MKCNEKIKQLRKQQGWTQETLGELCQVSRQAVSLWESQETYPDIENLITLSNLFHVSIDDLVKEDHQLHIESVEQTMTCKDWMHRLCTIQLKGYTSWDQGYEDTIILAENESIVWFMSKQKRHHWTLGILRKSHIERVSECKKKRPLPELLEIPTTALIDPFHYFIGKTCDMLLHCDSLKDALLKENSYWSAHVDDRYGELFNITYNKDHLPVNINEIVMIKEV